MCTTGGDVARTTRKELLEGSEAEYSRGEGDGERKLVVLDRVRGQLRKVTTRGVVEAGRVLLISDATEAVETCLCTPIKGAVPGWKVVHATVEGQAGRTKGRSRLLEGSTAEGPPLGAEAEHAALAGRGVIEPRCTERYSGLGVQGAVFASPGTDCSLAGPCRTTKELFSLQVVTPLSDLAWPTGERWHGRAWSETTPTFLDAGTKVIFRGVSEPDVTYLTARCSGLLGE